MLPSERYSRAGKFLRGFVSRCVSRSATGCASGALSPVATLFLILLIILWFPSQMIALAHGIPVEAVVGDAVSTLALCYFLYRLCLGTAHRLWFIAISVPTLYMAMFCAPCLGWCALFVLFLVHRYASGRRKVPPSIGQATSPDAAHADASNAHSNTRVTGSVGITEGEQSFETRVDIIALDPICKPYARLLFSERILRACTAALTGAAMLAGPAVVFWAVYDFNSPLLGLLGAGAITIFLESIVARIGASGIVLVICGAIAVLYVLYLSQVLQLKFIVNGSVWYYFTAIGSQLSLIGVAAMGSIIIVKRRNDVALMRILRQNGICGWGSALLRLCGVILPRGASLRSLKHKSLVLSILAFGIEGLGLSCYLEMGNKTVKLMESLPQFLPGPLSPIEANYFSIVTVVCAMCQ